MKKRVLFFILSIFLFASFTSAVCTINPVLINQDPVDAVPGERVKVLLQVQGVENPECNGVTFEFIEEYPFSLEPGSQGTVSIGAGTFVRSYNSYLMVPLKLLVHENAIDGEYTFKTKVSSDNSPITQVTEFNLSVEDVLTDFIVTIDSYSFATNELIFGLVNIGDADARAVTLEIPSQDGIEIIGGNKKIIGDLDSTEDTTVRFDAVLENGEIEINLAYNDENSIRRYVQKTISFSEKPFLATQVDENKVSPILVVVVLLVVSFLVYYFFKKRKKK